MSTHADSKPWTVPALAEATRNGQKLVMLTAYDPGFARTFDANGVDLILRSADLDGKLSGESVPAVQGEIALKVLHYFSPSLDRTQAIMDIMNRNYKVTKGAAGKGGR